METPDALQQRVRREQQMIARLRLAMTRLADAERERIWAMVAAKEAGLSIRQIARATGVSPTRVHQLLQGDEAREIPVWLSQLYDPRPAHPATQANRRHAALRLSHLTDGEILRWHRVAGAFRAEDHVVVNRLGEGDGVRAFDVPAYCVCWPGLRRTSTARHRSQGVLKGW
jgi:hypothetical protein